MSSQDLPHDPRALPDPSGAASVTTDSDARTWAALCHASGILALTTTLGFLGPLVVWLIMRSDHRFIDEAGKEAVNFQLSMLLITIALAVLAFLTCGLGLLVTVPLGLVMLGLHIVLPILAAVRASDGRHYRYPLTLRFLR